MKKEIINEKILDAYKRSTKIKSNWDSILFNNPSVNIKATCAKYDIDELVSIVEIMFNKLQELNNDSS